MAQQVLRSRVTMQPIDASLDPTSMDFYWEATGSNVGINISDVTSAIATFFNGSEAGQGLATSAYISSDVSRADGDMRIDYYDITNHLSGDPAGSPIQSVTTQLGAATNNEAMPPGLAVALAYRADYGSALEHGPVASLPSSDDAQDQGAPPTHFGRTRPRSQLRGRIYFGPLSANAFHTLSGGGGGLGGQLSTAVIHDLGLAFGGLAETKNAGTSSQLNLVQWSRRGAAVNPVRWYFVNENAASRRNRADTTLERVHNWVAVPQ